MAAENADAVRIDCGGVPMFWIEAPAPYRVQLQFRVGRADETLPEAGVTHLCEHLALSGLQGAPYAFNGQVELNRCVFGCQGTADESRHFLEETCRQLAELPVERLVHEKRILRTEAAGRLQSIIDAMLGARFGATTYGLNRFPEFGMWTVDGERLRRWAARWFTRGNAVGWVVGPEPLYLELALPPGDRIPPPTPFAKPGTFPAVTRLPARIAGAASVIPRSSIAVLGLAVMTARLQSVLRFEMGAAYQVRPFYLPLSADAAWISMMTDLSDSRMEETVHRFVAVLKDLATRGPLAEEVERQRAAGLAAMESHGWEDRMANFTAFNELLGAPETTQAALHDEYRSVTSEQIRDLAGAVVSDALYQVPLGLDVELDGVKPLADGSSWAAEGVAFEQEALLPGPHQGFVLDERGMTVWVGDQPLSVEWDGVAAMLSWADGGRRLIGDGRVEILVVPTRVQRGRDLVSLIDRHVSPELTVALGKRMCVPIAPAIRRNPAVARRWGSQVRAASSVAAVLVLGAGVLLMQVVHDAGAGVGAASSELLGVTELLALGATATLAVGAVFGFRRRAETSVGGGVGGVETYHVADPQRQRLPAGVPANRIYVGGGHLLAFLVLHDLVSEWFVAESGGAIAQLRRREITGTDLYELWGGVLASDMISDAGNEFLFRMLCLRTKDGSQRSRYGSLVNRLEDGPYQLLPGWEAYDRLEPSLEDELHTWRSRRRLYHLLRYVQPPPRF
jgi:predicted Zn-dependent peptidase